MKKTFTLLGVLASFSTLKAGINDQEWFVESFGFRSGVDDSSFGSLESYELFATIPSKYEWKIGGEGQVDLKFEAAVGILNYSGGDGCYARFGPQLELGFDDFPITFVIGSGPAYLSDHTYGGLDLGGRFQFISSIGFDWALSESWSFGYRWQHISNAGVHDRNPGLNLNTLGFTYRF